MRNGRKRRTKKTDERGHYLLSPPTILRYKTKYFINLKISYYGKFTESPRLRASKRRSTF